MLLSGAGHVADMIARMKANRQLTKHSNPLKKNDPLIYKGRHDKLNFKKVSLFQKKKFLIRVQENSKKQLLFDRLLLASCILITIVGFIWLVGFLN